MATGTVATRTIENQSNFLVFAHRPSASPCVEKVWRCHSEHAGAFLSVAASHFEMVVTRHKGRICLTLRGPETKATTAHCPADGEWVGIRFKLGTFMPQLPAGDLRDRRDMTLAGVTCHSFWLNGSVWEYPTHVAGYFDQAHLTRSLTYLIGQTPGKIIRGEEQLSFLYKTSRRG